MKETNKIIISLLALSMMLLLCVTAYADGLKLTLVSSADSLSEGDTFKVDLNFTKAVGDVTYTFEYDHDILELREVVAYGGTSSASADTQDRYSWLATDLKERSTPVYAVFKVRSAKAGDVIKVGVKDIKVSSAPDFETVIPTVIPFEQIVISNETGCESIKVTAYMSAKDKANADNGVNYVIYPKNGAFSLDSISYRTPYFTIEATAVDSDAKIQYSAKEGFLSAGGGATLTVTVTAPSGDSAKYTVKLKALNCIHEFEQVAGSYVAPTCSELGSIKEKCSFCKTEKTIVIQKVTHNYNQTVVAPTCKESGYTLNICSVCSHEYKSDETEVLEHSYVVQSTTSTCKVLGQTVYKCSVCEEENIMQDTVYGAHRYTSEVIKPTCMEPGKTVHTCEVCLETHEDSYTDAAGHFYKPVVTEPTCSDSGYTTFTCELCRNTYVDKYTGATGHRYGEWVTEIVATSEKDGIARRTCTHCKASETQVIPKLVRDGDGINNNTEATDWSLILIIVLAVGIVVFLILVFLMYFTLKKKSSINDDE